MPTRTKTKNQTSRKPAKSPEEPFPLRYPVDIVYISTDLQSGGTTKNLLNLVRGLPFAEFTPHVLSLGPVDESTREQLDRSAVSWDSLDVTSPPHPESFFRLVNELESIHPAIVHTFLFHANIYGRFAAFLADVPIVLSSVRVCEEERRSHLWLDRWTHSLVDCEICVSPAIEKFTREEGKIPAQKLTTIPNGVDLPLRKWDVNESALREEHSISPGRPLLLGAGRLTKQKGFDILLNALPALKQTYPELVCVIFGEGEEREPLETQIEQLSLQDTAFLPGWTDALPVWLQMADLFLLPSRWEGFPNVLLEAAAMEVPIVATRTGGTQDLFESVDADGGLLVEKQDEGAISSAVIQVLNQKKQFEKQAVSFGEQVRAKFSVSRMVSEHRDLYRQMIRSKFEYPGTKLD